MIGVFNTIMIGNTEVFRPNDMDIKREDVYRGEYTTCTGKIIADRIGWRYSDMRLKWDTLTTNMLDALLSSWQFEITFEDADGIHTEQVIRDGYTNTPTRFTGYNGEPVWKDIEMGVRFINVHTDE